ncbi:MAG: glycosyltransferase [Deltaproteobacteria bacterium]|nr:glycosyltransferase [Deltaproteobacteria bacterium]
MIWMLLTSLPLLMWGGLLLAPWQPWRTREVLDANASGDFDSLTDVTVVIPARDEARYIDRTLEGVRAQGPGPRIILVDDQSTDDTARVAACSGGPSPVSPHAGDDPDVLGSGRRSGISIAMGNPDCWGVFMRHDGQLPPYPPVLRPSVSLGRRPSLDRHDLSHDDLDVGHPVLAG